MTTFATRDRFTFDRDDPVAAYRNLYPEAHDLLTALGFGTDLPHSLTLAEACAEHGHDASGIQRLIARHVSLPPDERDEDWGALEVDELADHIVRIHHDYLLAELGRMDVLLTELAEREPTLAAEVCAAWQPFRTELTEHMLAEEVGVFSEARALAHHVPKATLEEVDRAMVHNDHGHAHNRDLFLRVMRSMEAPWPRSCHTPVARITELLANMERDFVRHHAKEEDYLLPALVHAEEIALGRRRRYQKGAEP